MTQQIHKKKKKTKRNAWGEEYQQIHENVERFIKDKYKNFSISHLKRMLIYTILVN
jgi:hypothetical protein